MKTHSYTNLAHTAIEPTPVTNSKRRRAFTLVELLVVIAIVGILMGLLMPAIQSIRATAQRTDCLNNIRQMVIASQNYQANLRRLPPAYEVNNGVVTSGNGSWSIHARLLPYVEQDNAFEQIDFDVAWSNAINLDTGVPTTRIPMYICASEINDTVRLRSGVPRVYPQNYGFNFGSWLVYDPVNGTRGDGVFYVNGRTRLSDIKDGLSNTLLVAEVNAFTPYIRDTADPGPTPPTATDAFVSFTGDTRLGPDLHDNTGHTEWCDGRVHHSGFTTVYLPNTDVTYELDGQTYSIDFNSRREGTSTTESTYAAITSRSYHAGGLVNAAFVDGSSRAISDSIDLQLWRALGTRDGGEVTTSDF